MPLGQLVGALGRFSTGSGRFAGAFWLPGPPRVSILKGVGTAEQGFGSLWEHVLACILLHLALRNQKLFFMQ